MIFAINTRLSEFCFFIKHFIVSTMEVRPDGHPRIRNVPPDRIDLSKYENEITRLSNALRGFDINDVRTLNDHHLLIILNNLNDLRNINIDYIHTLEGLRTGPRDEITRSNLNYRVGPNVIIEDEEEDNEKMRNKDEKTMLKDYDPKMHTGLLFSTYCVDTF